MSFAALSDSLSGKQRALFISKRENNIRKIQELGSLPPPTELKKFSGKSVASLEKALDTINTKLKKYSHVNKKAFDQYVNFNETRMSLLDRKKELDHSADKVLELIESLDLKKDEAINRTFRGVSGHFKDVFKELVPNGAGEIIMRTEHDNESDVTDIEQDSSDDGSLRSPAKKKGSDKSNPDVSLYRGIGIKVRFSEVGENFIMSQLSGGQKALVALALIFAIQRTWPCRRMLLLSTLIRRLTIALHILGCDPAPFYLFDELDQALDSTYRAAVARLIQRQADSEENPTQFIVSTFRQELVAVANHCYGVSHQNKVSSLHHMPKQDAQLFIANLNQDEEAVGDVTSLAASKASGLAGESRKRKSVSSYFAQKEAIEEAVNTDAEDESEASDMMAE
jgi:structural maintenance of chromosome 3 (chondroitin sulfate proteoglycan 6)